MVCCGTEQTYVCFKRSVEIMAKTWKAIDSGSGGWSEHIDSLTCFSGIPDKRDFRPPPSSIGIYFLEHFSVFPVIK